MNHEFTCAGIDIKKRGFAGNREASVFSDTHFPPGKWCTMIEREEQRMFDPDGEARERLVVWIRRRMDEYGITLEDLEAALEADAAALKAPKYRDAYGNTWDGTGDRPEWLTRAIHAGQDIEHFRC